MSVRLVVPPGCDTRLLLDRWVRGDGEKVGAGEIVCVLAATNLINGELWESEADMLSPADGLLRQRARSGGELRAGDLLGEIEPMK